MTCDELRDEFELYILGVADDPEGDEIREHLRRDCEVCMAGVKQARRLATLLGGTAQPAAPSPKLRRRILASVGVEPHTSWWGLVAAAVAALCLVAAFYFSGREH